MEKNCAYSRSDLACECIETKRGGLREYERYGFRCTELTIRAGGEEKIYKNSAGRYVTMSPGRLWLWDDRRAARFTDALADEITDFFEAASKQKISESSSVLVCGLGNRFITSDALGPQTLDKLTVTRHAVGCGGILDSLGCSRISAIVPGTLGQTGMEALTIIKGGIAEVKPDALIVIDALCARSLDRLAATVQISDSGIRPGSGIGNSRREITGKTAGVPVISIGIPTIVDSSTLVYDALERAGIGEFSDEVRAVLDGGRDFFVAPKECDMIIDRVSSMLSEAIEKAFGL